MVAILILDKIDFRRKTVITTRLLHNVKGINSTEGYNICISAPNIEAHKYITQNLTD